MGGIPPRLCCLPPRRAGGMTALGAIMLLRRLHSEATKAWHCHAAGDLCHLGLSERFALLDRVFHCGEDHFFQKIHVVWINDFLIDLNRNHVARAISHDLYFTAASVHLHRLLLELGLGFRHLFLHLLRLLHQLVQIHSRVLLRFYLSLEHFERFLDERIVLVGIVRSRRSFHRFR